MPITLKRRQLNEVLDQAFLLATGETGLPEAWLTRANQLENSPSLGFIAAVGAVLLAKATDAKVDSFVIQRHEGSPGAYSLRAPATVLGQKRHAYGYDIGSNSDRDPINHGTLIGSKRWDIALDRILPAHKPFFQVILGWLTDVNRMSEGEALEALAAYIRVRRAVASSAAVETLPPSFTQAPPLTELVDVLQGFVSADTEHGARGMALVAAAYRAAGFETAVPGPTNPLRIDIPIKHEGELMIATEVKQLATREATADTLVEDARRAGARRALLAVLPPGVLLDFDVPAVVRRAERANVVLRVVDGVRPLLHEAISAGPMPVESFCAEFPRAYADALRAIRVSKVAVETWAAMAQRWLP